MASNMEPLPLTPQKRDPAWKHCEVFKNGDKVKIKCIYCGKLFSGGGIFRVKEHLAGQKGNSSTCPKVDPNVRLSMQVCLNEGLARRKKQKDSEEMDTHTLGPTIDASTSENGALSDQGGGLNAPVELSTLSSLNMGVEFSPLSSTQKRDPAWKHCEMYKDGNKVHLKCIYCEKVFKGGGITRVKEHLACRKGNGSTCSRVLPEVRISMQESLNAVVTRNSKKQKLDDKVDVDGAGVSEVGTLSNQCLEVESVQVPDTNEQNGGVFVPREGGKNRKLQGRKRGRPRNVSPSGEAAMVAVPISQGDAMNDEVHMAIARFLLDAGVPLDAVKSVYFKSMIDAIASPRVGVALPSYHELRSRILKTSVQELKNEIERCSGTWATTGCSLLVDEWTTQSGKSFVNFSVYCPERTIFLKSMDLSNIMYSDGALFDSLKEVVEEIGVRNILQVVTSNEERYVDLGKRLTNAYPSLFWTPCAAECIDLMLEDIKSLEWISGLFDQAKAISTFIYNHSSILNMMRRYTFGVDLVDLGLTRSATDFLTLKRMVNVKQNLQSMVTSEEWTESTYAIEPKGLEVQDLISNQSFWYSCTTITRLIDPLLRLLRIVSNAKKPAIGYVYAGLYRAKETIKNELVDKEYLVYWNIIDERWNQLQHHPLHAAGFFLNPRFFYSTEEDAQNSTRSLVYNCIEKLIPDPKIQDKIVVEITNYQKASGDFGRDMAVRARETLLPCEWWAAYGGGCPNLTRFATRILCQTCSLISARPSRGCLEQINKTTNSLEHKRLTELALVRSNLHLRGEMVRERNDVDPIAPENLTLCEEWVSGSELDSDESWCTVDPPLGNGMLSGPATDDTEALGSGFNDHEILDFSIINL